MAASPERTGEGPRGLSFGALVQAVPAASAVPATVEVCLSPEDDCAEFAERAIAGAQREILVSAYRLTVGSGIYPRTQRRHADHPRRQCVPLADRGGAGARGPAGAALPAGVAAARAPG